jgi:hypothetical protein
MSALALSTELIKGVSPIVLQSTMLHHLQSSQADAALFPMTAPKDRRSPVGEKSTQKTLDKDVNRSFSYHLSNFMTIMCTHFEVQNWFHPPI